MHEASPEDEDEAELDAARSSDSEAAGSSDDEGSAPASLAVRE